MKLRTQTRSSTFPSHAEFPSQSAKTRNIINGHVPVRVTRGESSVKAGGRLIVIHGGFSRACQGRTGIAGYTVIYNSCGLLLATHHALESTEKAIEVELDTDPKMEILESNGVRIRVEASDRGRDVRRRIEELKALLSAHRTGLIQEKWDRTPQPRGPLALPSKSPLPVQARAS